MTSPANSHAPVIASPPCREHPVYELFLQQLACLKDAEFRVTHALPLLAALPCSPDLKRFIQLHHKETERHVECLAQIGESLGEDLMLVSCKAMKGLIKESLAVGIMKLSPACQDRAVIAFARKIEHYEMAACGSLHTWAVKLDLKKEAAMLMATLEQKKIADGALEAMTGRKCPLINSSL